MKLHEDCDIYMADGDEGEGAPLDVQRLPGRDEGTAERAEAGRRTVEGGDGDTHQAVPG